MISLIICSIDPARFAAVEAMYRSAFGDEPWEMIDIHDARSLAEGYNRGAARSRGQTLIFSHDDIEILSPGFAQRVKSHLERFDLIGVAGTSRLINGYWASAGAPYIFGQVCHVQSDQKVRVDIYGTPRPAVGGIQALDGLFLAARRSLLDKVSFDAVTFDQFHLYDLDFSFAAYRAGFQLGVVNDINILHRSLGKFDHVWAEYGKRFEAKWRAHLHPGPQAMHRWTGVIVQSHEHALEVMNPPYWREKT
jgi:GT2 family glycosyltransferase